VTLILEEPDPVPMGRPEGAAIFPTRSNVYSPS